MAQFSLIEWTDHTFNPWMGCTKVSAGCQHCYAEARMEKRWKKVKWGPAGARVRTSAAMWKEPLKWNTERWAECQACGWRGSWREAQSDLFGAMICPQCDCGWKLPETRQRVFCASLADVFEERAELDGWRAELWDLIYQTEHLDWLLLTKRPENIQAMLMEIPRLKRYEILERVWLGTSVENQKAANYRIPALLAVECKGHFLSCEPLLGPVDLAVATAQVRLIDWVIVGGESGWEARPMEPDWVRDLRAQCEHFDLPFFFKQWGEWSPFLNVIDGQMVEQMIRVGKKAAGRMLDGVEYGAWPKAMMTGGER